MSKDGSDLIHVLPESERILTPHCWMELSDHPYLIIMYMFIKKRIKNAERYTHNEAHSMYQLTASVLVSV